MKTKINAIIIVEGKSDIAFLESFIEAQFVSTNGSEIPQETITYLQALRKNHSLIVLTDPDTPGKRIRDILDQKIPDLFHVYVNKEKAIKKHKVGVAEASKKEVLRALSAFHNDKETGIYGILSINDLYALKLLGKENSSQIRQKVARRYQLGYVSTAKELLKRLNLKNISYQELEREIFKDVCK